MIGNSLKSDVLPVINSGSSAILWPFYTTWQHEVVDEKHLKNEKYLTLNVIHDIVKYLHK
jgi:putative hydrolase of the HAD superfamily